MVCFSEPLPDITRTSLKGGLNRLIVNDFYNHLDKSSEKTRGLEELLIHLIWEIIVLLILL
jgi:hypothetical protein